MSNSFAYLGDYNKDTLRFQNYDPYPELKGPFSDYKPCRENYTEYPRIVTPYNTIETCWRMKSKYST
jgi:hypothetical protein